MDVFEATEFEYVLKFEVAPFLVSLGPIFARNLGIIRDRWMVRAWRRLQMLHKDMEHWRKFWH